MTNATRMMAERGSEKNRVAADEPHYIRIRAGMPSTLKLVSPEGQIFRHYTSEQVLQKILVSKNLRAGWTPFYYSGYISDYNESLTGIFMTSPGTQPHSVGVRSENKGFLDFKVPAGTGILYLRDGILLIPGNPTVEPWKIKIYQSKDRQLYNDYALEFSQWDKYGILPPLEIPIEIVGHGLVP